MEPGVFIGDDALRPEETVAERLRWAFNIEPTDPKSQRVVEAVDYRGQMSSAVISDCLDAMGFDRY